jgi:hypothetical protein
MGSRERSQSAAEVVRHAGIQGMDIVAATQTLFAANNGGVVSYRR